ncbi:MAG: RNA polymerase sigma factor (sigma-70 family), partial [Verrucomicrobiales bacterium]
MDAVTPDTPPVLDRLAFSGKAREHHRQLLAYGFALTADRELARDLVQDAFIAAYQNLGRFEVSRDFGAWMRGIVRNKWRDWMKRKKLTPLLLGEDELERLEAEHTAWEALCENGRSDVFESLEECVEQLPEAL